MSKELRLPRINSVVISGRLTREIELKYTQSGKAVAKLSLAFSKSYKKNGEWVEETSYIDIVVWDKLAIRCAEELDKGSAVLVEGSLKTHTYQNKDNKNVKVTEINAFKVNFLEKKQEDYAPQDNSVEQTNEPIKDDDVPF